ncbi:CpsD/CapB family tyrosine-protein kinase [Anaerorhabdus furcosa]|uniref:non-specific protein-tyrosine kinase n=1 Tax=Anaerorhabdus furcosa TaxID=118967 RepID=A0A1T4NDR5_9FIRM|nr:CpsD/CapB family tyrosine-protein kinase [Anaerorhabdus furcosa]SJZ77419.1 capsular exopolysaccharide family [Anaerorhabdus furcosa]
MTNVENKMLKDLISIYDSSNPATEAYRALRTNIMYKNFDAPIKVINITSATQGEGKSTTCLNLAVVFSQLNKKVLVMDLDLRIPTIHKKLRIRNTMGITDLLNGRATVDNVVKPVFKNIDVITTGTKIIYHSEFIQSTALMNFIERMKDEYDIILLDCPPVGIVTDALIVSKYSDGTILVCESDKNDKKTLIRVKYQFDEVESKVLGVVITKADFGKKYYSHYNYQYQPKARKRKKK